MLKNNGMRTLNTLLSVDAATFKGNRKKRNHGMSGSNRKKKRKRSRTDETNETVVELFIVPEEQKDRWMDLIINHSNEYSANDKESANAHASLLARTNIKKLETVELKSYQWTVNYGNNKWEQLRTIVDEMLWPATARIHEETLKELEQNHGSFQMSKTRL